MEKNLQLALNSAVQQYTAHVQQFTRAMAAAAVGMPADQKRSRAWCEYGWPAVVDYGMLYSLYRRGGLAHGAVTKLIANCWKTNPWVIENEDNAAKATRWEKDAKKTASIKFWSAFKEADKRRLVGRFAGLILRIADGDGGQWASAVASSGERKLLEMIPAWAGQLTPGPLITDPKSQYYGMPHTWNYVNGSTQATIHHTRIFILGDFSNDAIGFLEPAYNDFVNIEKLSGGSGESFLKNAARQVNINFDKEVKLAEIAKAHGVKPDQLQEVFDKATREFNIGNDASFVTQGATVTPVVATMPDPEKPYDVSVSNISSAIDMPTRVLIGNQSGERSSTEDRDYHNSRCQSRRNDLSLEASELITHLQRVGCVPAKDVFTVVWDDLTAPTKAERLANAFRAAEINDKMLGTGEETFSTDEVRELAGYEPAEKPRPLPEGADDEA